MTSHTHKHSPGDFCFVKNDDLREALGTAYAMTERHNMWWVFRKSGPDFFLDRMIQEDPVSDAFRALAYRYMTRIAVHGWDAFVEYYEGQLRKPREPCLLDQIAVTGAAAAFKTLNP
jgi:hypothetical protein